MDYSKIKVGDTFTYRGLKGTIFSKPEYIVNNSSGLYYADVELESGVKVRSFMICRTDIKWGD